MPSIGDPITQTIPVVGTTGTSYATQINDFLTEVRTRLEARLPLSSLLVGELNMANNPITDVSLLGLYQNTSADTDAVGSLQNIAGDLYYISSTGAIQVTSAGAVNASGIGGITGDYGGANPAQLRFDDGTKIYQFYDDFSGLAWGYTKQLGVDITGGSTSLVRARVTWAGAASMSIVLPAALPASQTLLQMDAAGQMIASNSLASNQDITFSGTGDIKHGDRVISHLPRPMLDGTLTTIILAGSAPALHWRLNGAAISTNIPLEGLRVGDRIKTVKIYGDEGGGTNPTLSLVLGSTPGGLTIATTNTSTWSANGFTLLTVDTPADGVVFPSQFFNIRITSGSVLADPYVIDITYDRP